MDKGHLKNTILEVSALALKTIVGSSIDTITDEYVSSFGTQTINSESIKDVPSELQKVFEAYRRALEKCILNNDISEEDITQHCNRLEMMASNIKHH